jgi:hypothetical protein
MHVGVCEHCAEVHRIPGSPHALTGRDLKQTWYLEKTFQVEDYRSVARTKTLANLYQRDWELHRSDNPVVIDGPKHQLIGFKDANLDLIEKIVHRKSGTGDYGTKHTGKQRYRKPEPTTDSSKCSD